MDTDSGAIREIKADSPPARKGEVQLTAAEAKHLQTFPASVRKDEWKRMQYARRRNANPAHFPKSALPKSLRGGLKDQP